MFDSLRIFLATGLISAVSILSQSNPVCAQEPENVNWTAPTFGFSIRKPAGRTDAPRQRSKSNPIESSDGIIRVDTRLVINDVLVLDKSGNAVRNLVRDDFRVLEDGDAQEISTFAPGNDSGSVPRSIVLVIDYSGSQLPYINASVAAAKALVDKLNPNDRMAIVTDDIELLTDFSSNSTLLKEKLDYLGRKAMSGEVGKSRQYSALMATLREMFREGEPRPIIIFQTDGDELLRLGQRAPAASIDEPEWDKFSYADVLAAAEQVGASINVVMPGLRFDGLTDNERMDHARQDLEFSRQAYAIISKKGQAFGSNGFSKRFVKAWADARSRDQAALGNLAKSTGGWSANLVRPEDADEAYKRIFSSIDLRYMVGYYPSNQARDGKRRDVTVKVRNCPDCVVWGRKTYIAPGGDR